MTTRARALVPILCFFMTLACKGETRISPAPLGVTPEFQAETTSPGSDSVSLQKSDVNGQHLTVDVLVTGVSQPISGIAIKLRFPGEIALFEGCSDGDLLPDGPCYDSPAPLSEDEVFIGRTIVSPEQPVPVVGSKTIVKLHFLVFGACLCSPNVDFQAPNLGGGDSTALLDAAGDPIFVTWYGGTLSGH